MKYDEVADQFHENGYALARGVFSRQEIAEIMQELDRLVRTSLEDFAEADLYFEDAPDKPIKALHNLEKYSPRFQRLAEDRRLLQLMQAIWPDVEIIPHGIMFFGKAAHSGSMAPAHQDNAFQNLEPPEDLVCTIAIDASTPENGALTVQRGSHKLGRLPHRPSGVMGFSQTLITPLDKNEYPEVQLCMEPGDICLHHTNTVHYSSPNTTDRSRRQVGIGYRSARAQLDDAGWTRYQDELKKLHASQPSSA